MFEEEVDEMAVNNAKKKYGLEGSICMNIQECAYVNGFQQGVEFGYNKANEWHYVKDGDLPKEDLRPRTLGYYLTALRHKSYKGFVFEVAYFTGVVFTKEGQICDNVIAWKEIVLPKENE